MQLEHREPVVEIRAKAAALDLLLQVAVRGREHPHVDVERLASAETPYLAGLERAEEVALHAWRHVGDLVEEQRAPMGDLEQPGARAIRPGERPALVAEQLALEQGFGEAGAVDGDELAVAPGAAGVDQPGGQLLAGPRLAVDDHRLARGHDLVEPRVHLLHGGGGADDAVVGLAAHGLGAVALDRLLGPLEGQGRSPARLRVLDRDGGLRGEQLGNGLRLTEQRGVLPRVGYITPRLRADERDAGDRARRSPETFRAGCECGSSASVISSIRPCADLTDQAG